MVPWCHGAVACAMKRPQIFLIIYILFACVLARLHSTPFNSIQFACVLARLHSIPFNSIQFACALTRLHSTTIQLHSTPFNSIQFACVLARLHSTPFNSIQFACVLARLHSIPFNSHASGAVACAMKRSYPLSRPGGLVQHRTAHAVAPTPRENEDPASRAERPATAPGVSCKPRAPEKRAMPAPPSRALPAWRSTLAAPYSAR
jgi:hypothetical protein